MSCLALTAAPFNENQNEGVKDAALEKVKPRRTLLSSQSATSKDANAPSERVQNVLNAIAANANAEHVKIRNEGSTLAEFQPLPATTASCNQQPKVQTPPIPGIGGRGMDTVATVREGFNSQNGNNDSQADSAYQQLLPLYAEAARGKTSNSTSSQNDLVGKLNRIINMLEEQEDSRTGHVAEEIVLYGFLGVFVIFIVDSFARAGKYVR